VRNPYIGIIHLCQSQDFLTDLLHFGNCYYLDPYFISILYYSSLFSFFLSKFTSNSMAALLEYIESASQGQAARPPLLPGDIIRPMQPQQ